MRLRYVKNAFEILEENKELVAFNPELNKGKWKSVFNTNGLLSLEVGSGKGQFLLDSGIANPTDAFIGLEMMTSVICRAVQKLKEKEIKNVLLINKDANHLLEYFEIGEVDKLYLNFPDPWPKARHEKRRLTSMSFLEKYKTILSKDGTIRFKTDNLDLYNYSLENFSKVLEEGFKCGESVYTIGDIQTEFETKYRLNGKTIYYIEGKFKR